MFFIILLLFLQIPNDDFILGSSNPRVQTVVSPKISKSLTEKKITLPNITIGGNTGTINIGDIIILSADYNSSQLPEEITDLQFNWTVLDDQGKPKKIFVGDNGRQIAFAAGMTDKRITVLLDINCLFETKKTEIIIGAGAITPPVPNPNPNPNPAPISPEPTVLPAGQFGLAQFTYQTFMSDTFLDMSSKIKLANVLAKSLESVVLKISPDLATALADIRTANDNAFNSSGVDVSKTSNLQIALRKKIYELYQAKKLNNSNDLIAVCRELALGLRAVK